MEIDITTLLILGAIGFLWFIIIFRFLRQRGKTFVHVIPESGKIYTKWKKERHGEIEMIGPVRGKKVPVWTVNVKRGCFLRVKKLFGWVDSIFVTEDADDAIDFSKDSIEVPIWSRKTMYKLGDAKVLEHAGEGEKQEKTNLIIISILLSFVTLAFLFYIAYNLRIIG